MRTRVSCRPIVKADAELGVDLISVGAFTHSVKALNIALDYESR
jgi:nicotinate-nucleotide pyrophosphorylase